MSERPKVRPSPAEETIRTDRETVRAAAHGTGHAKGHAKGHGDGPDGASVTTVRCAMPHAPGGARHGNDATTGADAEHLPDPPTSVATGHRLVDEGILAKGGMSAVHRVFDNLILRPIALKSLRDNASASDLTRFIEEAQITGQLDHPNIVPVYDMLTDERGLPSRLAMKLIEGKTLHELHHAYDAAALKGRVLEDLVRVLIKVCDAVAFAHSRGIVHRDLKPSNIMVGTHGQVYLMDWGIALVRHGMSSSEERAKLPTIQVGTPGGTAEAHGSLCGTPPYMAPEQALGLIDSIDERTDIYGLGGILYHMLTLKPPHDGGDVNTDLALAKRGHVPDPRSLARGRTLPPGLCRIAMRALAPDPGERYPNADAMKADLEEFLRGGGWLEQRFFPRGTVVVEEGAEADAAYIITEGHCELHKMVNGEPRFIRLMGPGEAFGETAIFGSIPRTATVITSTDVTLLVVTRDALEQELDRSVWVRSFVEAMAERFLEVDRRTARLERELAYYRNGMRPPEALDDEPPKALDDEPPKALDDEPPKDSDDVKD